MTEGSHFLKKGTACRTSQNLSLAPKELVEKQFRNIQNAGPAAGWTAAAREIPSGDSNFVTDPTVYIGGGTGTSTGLLHRAVLRHADAWDKLVSLYGPLVYRWCRRWGMQAKDAENVGQEVFLRVLQGLPAFRHDRPGDSFRAWLHRIARNCYLDYVQRQTKAMGIGGSDSLKQMEQIPDDHASDKDPEATQREDDAILYQQVVQLIRREYTERDWTIFQRVVIGGDSPAAVAADLKVSSNVVYLIKSRVLHRLREEFAELIEF